MTTVARPPWDRWAVAGLAAPAGYHPPDQTCEDPHAVTAPDPVPVTAAATFCHTLVDQWTRRGLAHAVVSPGSRSTPMAVALAVHPQVRTHVHHDERSAAFVALGVALSTNTPVVVLTTSGSATAHLLPAVVEAAHAGVPLIACTADRPPEVQGRGAPQTIDQRRLFGVAARDFVDPGPPDNSAAATWRPLADRVWDSAFGRTPGPVQINLAFREPLVGEPGPLPAPTPVPPPHTPVPDLDDARLADLAGRLSGRRGVVVAGGRAASGPGEADRVHRLALALGWPVIADHLSACRIPGPATVAHADPLLRTSAFARDHRPEAVLRLGGLVSSRVVNEWLATCGGTQVGVDRLGRVPDPDDVVDDRWTTTPAALADALVPLVASSPTDPTDPAGWLQSWRLADDLAAEAISSNLDAATSAGGIPEPSVSRAVLASLPAASSLLVASSMPVRDLEWYGPPRADVEVLANRGTNGIDGALSTAAGVAIARGSATAVVGDLAFLHDVGFLGAPLLRHLDVRVVVVDNDGGGIFSFLPQASALPAEPFEQLFGTPHGHDLVAVARGFGLEATEVGTLEALRSALAEPIDGPSVVVVRSDRAINVEVHRRVNQAVADALTAAPTPRP